MAGKKPKQKPSLNTVAGKKKGLPEALEKAPPMRKANFFRNEKERDIWIRINAEVIMYSRKKRCHEDVPMGSVDAEQTCLWISKNQLDFDENNLDAPRFSLEQLIMLSIPELFRIELQKEADRVRECSQQNGIDEWR